MKDAKTFHLFNAARWLQTPVIDFVGFFLDKARK